MGQLTASCIVMFKDSRNIRILAVLVATLEVSSAMLFQISQKRFLEGPTGFWNDLQDLEMFKPKKS